MAAPRLHALGPFANQAPHPTPRVCLLRRKQGDEGEVADMAAVDALLAERSTARRERDFKTADALRAKLNKMGIFVDDKKRIWSLIATASSDAE